MENNYNNPQQPYPGQQQAYYNPPPQDPFQMLVNELQSTKGWLKLIGIFSIIMGGLYCLTIIGAIVGWLPIWVGIILVNASKNIETYIQTRSMTELIAYSRKMKNYFTIMGVMTIIGMVVMFIYIIIIIIAVSSGAFYMQRYF